MTVGGKDVYAKAREADIAKKELSELQGLYHEAQVNPYPSGCLLASDCL